MTTICWRDCLVWCNAATEWHNAKNGASDTCVYTYSGNIIRDATNATACDNAVASSTATGFRLPSMNEWELAARWRNDSTNTVGGYSNPYFTKGNSASEATTFHDDNSTGSGEPGKSANDIVAVYGYYWDGTWAATGVSSTTDVKSKGVAGSNSLGLYDMSGHASEWCFDSSGASRILRGGNWESSAFLMQVGHWISGDPDYAGYSLGFRLARTSIE